MFRSRFYLGRDTRRVTTGRNRDDRRSLFCRFLAATPTHRYAFYLTCSRRVLLEVVKPMKAEQEKKNLTGKDKSQGDLVDAGHQQTPDGLQRDRKPPLDKNVGRKPPDEDAPAKNGLSSREIEREKRNGPTDRRQMDH